MPKSITLPQSLLLLTLNDESGRPKAGFYKPAIAGAAISELLLLGSLTLNDDKKPKVIVDQASDTQSPFLNFIVSEISKAKKHRDMQYWVTKLGSHKQLIPKLAEELCMLGALKKETSKLFGLFTLTTWPEASPKFETDLKTHLQKLIEGTGPVDERSSVVIALAKSADVLRYNFNRDTLKANKERIKAISDGDLLATTATDKAIRAAQAALTAAIVTAAVVPTVTAS